MEIETIERYVDEALEVKGLVKGGDEQRIRLLLTHLYTAVLMYRMMNDDDKTLAILWNKEFKDFFSLKKFLKERKRKTDKEKEKKNTHIKGKVASKIEIRQKAFWDELLQYEDRYGRDMLSKFYLVWAEDVKNTGMMRWELEKSWNIKYRLAAFPKKSYQLLDEAARLRLERAKGTTKKPAADSAEQRAAAAEREEADARREAELAESRKNSISLEEYAKTHPDSQLARQFCKKGGGT